MQKPNVPALFSLFSYISIATYKTHWISSDRWQCKFCVFIHWWCQSVFNAKPINQCNCRHDDFELLIHLFLLVRSQWNAKPFGCSQIYRLIKFSCVCRLFSRLPRQCLFKNVWWWWASFGVVFSWIWLDLWPTTNRAHAREKKCDSMNLKWSKMLPSDNLYWFSHGIPPSQFVNNHWRQLTNDTK